MHLTIYFQKRYSLKCFPQEDLERVLNRVQIALTVIKNLALSSLSKPLFLNLAKSRMWNVVVFDERDGLRKAGRKLNLVIDIVTDL